MEGKLTDLRALSEFDARRYTGGKLESLGLWLCLYLERTDSVL